MIMNDRWILSHGKDIFEPFTPQQLKEVDGRKIISHGVSSFGYDIQLANEWQVFKNANSYCQPDVIDPKNFKPELVEEFTGDECIIPPHGFVLCRSREYVKMPEDCLGICTGKSTYARCGVIANITPLEPEWEGHITIELSNTTGLPVKVYAWEGIAQLMFLKGDRPAVTYKDRGGKYLGQRGITQPKV